MSTELSSEVQTLITEEEEILKALYDSLHTQLSRVKHRLEIESDRARDLTSQIVAATRAEDKQVLASDEAVSHRLSGMQRDEVRRLEELLQRPYFARIVLEEERQNGNVEKVEYKLGLQSNVECRIVDWRRGPISRLYYEYKEGDEYAEEIQGRERIGRILVRNKVEIRDGELIKISCRHGDFEKKAGEWQPATTYRTRTAQSYARLPDVLSLITPEQFRTITEDADTAVIIQGVAGSGKTTVALHRLAWLLHESNSALKPDEVLIVVRSGALRTYIRESLSLLQIAGVSVLSYVEWAARTLKRIESFPDTTSLPSTYNHSGPPGIVRLKRSLALVQALEEYVQGQRARLKELIDRSVPWSLLPVSARQEYLGAVVKDNFPPLAVLQMLLAAIESTKRHARTAELSVLESVHGQLGRVAHRLELYREDVLRVLETPDVVLRFDETRLLDHQLLQSSADHLRQSYGAGIFDADDEAIFFRLLQLKNGHVAKTETSNGVYRCLIADEVQDFSPMELATVIGAVDDVSRLTLVGDTAQEVRAESSFPGWEKLRQHWKFRDSLSKHISLTVSHRSTLSIMRLGDYVLGTERTTGGRPGKPPLWFRCLTEDTGVTEAINWLKRVSERYIGGLILVLCRHQPEAREVVGLLEPSFGPTVRLGDSDTFSFDEGILVSDVSQVKGLEFQNVLIWNPSCKNYPLQDHSRRLLYVAITRAEENLCLVTWGQESKLLPDPGSKVVRCIEEELEPAEVEEQVD